jgi:hypothetical protein
MWRVITNSDSLSRKRYRNGKLAYTLHTSSASLSRVAIPVRMRDSYRTARSTWTRKGRCNSLSLCMILSENRFRFRGHARAEVMFCKGTIDD